MIIDQLFTSPLFEQAPMASPEQLAYNRLRAQWDGYQAMTSGGGNTAVSRDPAHAAKLATIPTELARMAAALKAKGIDAEAQYDALSGPAAAPVDANQAYGLSENKSDPITQFASNAHEEWRRNFDPTGTKPRIKKNSDGTEGDINVPFEKLHPDWQKENLAAGRAAQHAVKHFGNNMEKAAEFIHRQWMKRNPKGDWNAAQHVPYDELSDDEKEKDRVHVRTMMRLMGHQTNESGLRKFSHKKNRFKSLDKLRNPLGEEDAIDPSRRGFLKKAAGAAAAGAAMSAAGPEIVTLVKGFAEQAGGMNGIQALKAMLKVSTADELYNMYDYYSDSGILADAITDSDMRALQRVKGFRDYEDWSDFEEYCEDNNDVNPVEEFERLTGRPLKVSLVDDIVGKIDDTWSLENFFDEYPDALKLINPFGNGSISRPTMQQLAKIDTAAKGASLPTPIVAMANAVAGLVRQIFKANGQPLSEPQQVAQGSRAAPALPAPTRPEFDMTPDLKQKEKVPVQRKGDDEEQYYRPAPEHIQQALDAGQLGDKNFFQSIVDGTDKNPWVTPEKAQEILNKYYGPQNMAEAAQGHTIEAHGVRGMDRRTWHKTFRNTDQMMAWAEKHDAEIIGTRDLEQARHHNLSPAGQDMSEDEFDSFKFGKPITFSAYHSSKSKIKRILPTDEFYFSDDRHTWEDNYLYKIKITLKNPYVMLDQKAEFESHAKDSLPKIKAAGHDGVIYTPYSIDYGFRQGVCFYPQRQISSIKLVNQNITSKQGAAEGLTEMDKSEPSAGRDGGQQSPRDDRQSRGRDTGPRSGPDRVAKPVSKEKMNQDTGDILTKAFKDSHKKKDVKEGEIEQTKTGIRHRGDRYGSGEELPNGGGNRSGFPNPGKYARDLDNLDKGLTSKLDHSMGVSWPKGRKKQDMDENINPLMLKLQAAMVREGRVKELADDLKTMNDADFMKKYGKAKAAIRKDMKRVDEARSDYTPDEMADMLSGKRSQKQIDADAERTRGPNKAPPTKESTQSRAKRLNEKMSTSDTLAAGPGISRLGKKDMEPEIDFRKGLAGDDPEFFEPDVRIGKPVEPNAADTDAFMSAVDSYGEQNPYMQSWGGKFADQDTRIAPLRPGEFNVGGTTWRRVEDPAAAPAKKEVQWIPSSEADSIASWKANNPGKSAADWGSIPAAGKPAAASGLPKMRFDRATNSLVPVDQPVALDLSPKDKDKFDRQTRSVKPADGSGANPNIDAATRDRARAWAAQQNAPGAASAGAMRSSGTPVDTAKKKTDWKSIYNLNKSIIGSNPNLIKPGMKLKMPDGSTYRVQPGDNLSKIAASQSQINELSTNKLAQYKTAAAKDAKEADKEGDFKRGDKRFHGIVQATKKQFDNDDKKVDESRAARRALMARIVNSR